MRILPADLNDPRHESAIVAILDEYAREPAVPGSGLDEEVKRDLVSRLRNHPTTVVLLAEDDEEIIGLSLCFLGFSTFAAKPLLNIHDFAVRSDRRGQGVGKALIRATEEKARELGCCKLTLEVASNNERAYGLYRVFGFGPSRPGPDSGELVFLEKTLYSEEPI